MIEQSQIKEIKKLIRAGFSEKIIAFELNIPMVLVQQCKLQVGREQQEDKVQMQTEKQQIEVKQSKEEKFERPVKQQQNKSINFHKKPQVVRENKRVYINKKPMQEMRERYRELIIGENKWKWEETEKTSSEIDEVIGKVRKLTEGLEILTKEQRREKARSIIKELKDIGNSNYAYEQAEELNMLLNSEWLDELHCSPNDKIDLYIRNLRTKISNKLLRAIDLKISETEDLEELKAWNKKINTEIKEKTYLTYSMVSNKINRKITEIQQQKAIMRGRNDVPITIKNIINEIVEGTIDIERAKGIIDEEASKNVKSGPKNQFSLTLKQQKMQIFIKMENIIKNDSTKYEIKNPKETVLLLKELTDGELRFALRTVIGNLINAEKFDEAEILCDIFSKKDETLYEVIKVQRNRINKEKIGQLIVEMLNKSATEQEDEEYFQTIKNGLERGKVRLEEINIGKTCEGKNITLADIWFDRDMKYTIK